MGDSLAASWSVANTELGAVSGALKRRSVCMGACSKQFGKRYGKTIWASVIKTAARRPPTKLPTLKPNPGSCARFGARGAGLAGAPDAAGFPAVSTTGRRPFIWMPVGAGCQEAGQSFKRVGYALRPFRWEGMLIEGSMLHPFLIAPGVISLFR